MSLSRCTAICLLLATGVPIAKAQLPAAGDTVSPSTLRRDRSGDPLPPGALFRLGTTRLRHSGHVWAAAFSRDGKLLASSGLDRSVLVWDVETSALVRRLIDRGESNVHALAFSPVDDRLVAIERVPHRLRAWNTATGRELFNVDSGGVDNASVGFSPDGRRIVMVSGQVRIWDSASGSELRTLQFTDARSRNYLPFAFSRDGRYLAASNGSEDICVWDIDAGGDPVVIDQAHGRETTHLAFTADHRLVSSGFRLERRQTPTGGTFYDFAPELRVWDNTTGKRTGELPIATATPSTAFAMLPDGHRLVIPRRGGFDLWDIEQARLVRTLPADIDRDFGRGGFGISGLALSPDGKTLAARDESAITLWSMLTGEQLLQTEGHRGSVPRLDISPDGKTIATASRDGTVRVWDADSGREMHVMRVGKNWAVFTGFLPDGQRLAAAGDDSFPDQPGFEGVVQLWNVKTGELQDEQRGDHRIACASLGASGKLAVATYREAGNQRDAQPDYELRIVDLEQGGNEAVLYRDVAQTDHLAFTLDGSAVLTVNSQGVVGRWNYRAGTSTTLLTMPPQRARSFAFTIDRQYVLAAGRSDGALVTFDLATGQQSRQFTVPNVMLSVVAVSNDARVAVAGGRTDPRIWLFQLDTRKELRKLDTGGEIARSLLFSKDGQRLLAGMDNGSVLAWDVSTMPNDQ